MEDIPKNVVQTAKTAKRLVVPRPVPNQAGEAVDRRAFQRAILRLFHRPRCCHLVLRSAFLSGSVRSQFTGVSSGAPLSFTKNTTNLAGSDRLAFRATTCTSPGDS